ncbi:uncharacterized protein LOC126380249 [Pectinophora gossypiella]|uniref:uncharacterized protein LOC126380249 n=1 Tax=Pectinophora gossypiella TaxID=13191 RepID=UPI00214EA97C|nr:uncharacterized protein LOC126380249 [Pectinophora gossypiella]
MDTIPEKKEKERAPRPRGECFTPASSSHTHFYKKPRPNEDFDRVTRDQFLSISESISGSSKSYKCVHPEGRKYSEKALLKRNIKKELDPIRTDRKWCGDCPPTYGWEIAKTLEFLVMDPMGVQQTERLQQLLVEFSKISNKGFRIDTLDCLCTILDFLVESLTTTPSYREGLVLLLKNIKLPVLLNVCSDVITLFETLRNFIGFLGYLLMRLEDDELFELVAEGLLFQLSAPDSKRGHGSAQLRHTLAAAKNVLIDTVARMIAVAKPSRYPAYLEIAFLLACDSVDNCVALMMENIIENIFYRFNPYFPHRLLPDYECNPADLTDINIKLGESSVNLSMVLSLLLVLVKTMKQYVEQNPTRCRQLPCPDRYSQMCFIWAYRYECRAREHRHQRNTLTVIANVLLHVFGDRLCIFSNILMPDVMTLAVLTELPPRNDWTRTVSINTSRADVQFKKMLVYLSVDFLKVFPSNKFMVEDRNWVTGLIYLIDPGLSSLRAKWSSVLFAELRKTALQALMVSMKLIPDNLPTQHSLIRRTMWYVEWYSISPYELSVLYWCVRVLQVSLYERKAPSRKVAVRELLHSHGIIVLMHLCYKLIEMQPPLEKMQMILGLVLRVLTSSLEYKGRVTCVVYPHIKWPNSINTLVNAMLDMVMFSLEKHYITSDRWMIALLNFIWQAIIWKPEYRQMFLDNNGLYQLLDMVTMTRYPVQCLALALICDIARAGDAVGQLVTWRAGLAANYTDPHLVNRGATIATLLAALFKRECIAEEIALDDNNIIQDLDYPLISSDVKKYMYSQDFKVGRNKRTPVCLAAADLSGSRMSKCYALLQMLSEDLEGKVALADEAYNLYKNVKLTPEDEALLVLCSHFLTIKLNEAWMEALLQSPGYVPKDKDILDEFLQIGRGWAKQVQQQQRDVIDQFKKKESDKESSLHAFLGRVRLNIALDALREVRCVARTADRERIAYALLYEAVNAYKRRSVAMKKIYAPIIRTFESAIDETNVTSQYMKVFTIVPKEKPKKINFSLVSDDSDLGEEEAKTVSQTLP